MLNTEDRYKLFKARIFCALSQIKSRNLNALTSIYGVHRHQKYAENGTAVRVWSRDARGLHPLSIFIENKPASLGSTSYCVAKDIRKALRIQKRELFAFNRGLEGFPERAPHITKLFLDYPDCRAYFTFGHEVRASLKGKH